MRHIKFSTLALLSSLSLQATTIYYNGEGNDVGAWSIQAGSHPSATLTQVYDTTLNSNVMHFTDAGLYRLRLPNNRLWDNRTERVLSLDVNMDTYYTLWVYVDTLQGIRKLFYNPLNVHAGHHNNQNLPFIGADGTGIINSFGRHRTHRDNATHTRGWLNHPADRNNRNGWVRVTLDLDRDLRDIEPDNRITSVFSLKITGTSGMVDNVTLDAPRRVTLSTNAEDWSVSEGVPIGGVIRVIDDNEERGSVIELDGTANSSSFTTGAKEGANSWNNTQNDIIQWKIKTENWFKFIVHVNTTNGLRDMVYFPERVDKRFNSETGEIGIGIGERRHLGDASPDTNHDGIPDYDIGTGGTWQTFTRNVAMDVNEYEDGNALISINGVTVIGTDRADHNSPMIESNILIDDLQLFSSIVPTPSDGVEEHHEEAIDLHRWNLRNTSVKISFNDQAEGETGFIYINEATGEQLGNRLPATEGTGTASIGTLTGLTEGTQYTVRVHTLFDDGRETAISEPITFTTLGVAPNPDPDPQENNDEEATDLHRWSLRNTSVKISFRDNAQGEIGFRYIDEATGEQLGNTLPATADTGTASIGTIRGLTAGTTYRVQVETLFDDGRETATSEAIEFTTLGVAPQPQENNEEVTDVHRWALRDTSVKISFVDHSEGEIGFRYINQETGEQLGDTLPATEGRGTASIGTIRGLTEGTTYQVRVETLFNDGRATAVSEPISFTTLGVAPNPQGNNEEATDLHRWSLRDTSVKISFMDNAQGETGFRYIDEATGEQLGDTLPAVNGVGTATIGTIRGLTADTTYRVHVETLFNDGRAVATSETIEFTTLGE